MKILILICGILILIWILFSTKLLHCPLYCIDKHIYLKSVFDYEIDGYYKFFNPSIIRKKDGYILCTRYSNYPCKTVFMYMYNVCKYFNDTNIAFIHLTKDFEIQNISFPVLGDIRLEDPRILEYKDEYYISCTEYITYDNQLSVILKFNKYFKYVKKIYYNMGDYRKKTKLNKNWNLFIYNDKTYVHTDSYPVWNVYSINLEDGCMTMIYSYNTSSFFSVKQHLRCSTGWRYFRKNTYLCGLHTKEFWNKIPYIRSMLVEVDSRTLKPIKKTKVFCVDIYTHARVQFLSGLEIDDNYVILTYGIGDYKIVIKKISIVTVKKMLDT